MLLRVRQRYCNTKVAQGQGALQQKGHDEGVVLNVVIEFGENAIGDDLWRDG